jgi:CheY-like chemotaxis protein
MKVGSLRTLLVYVTPPAPGQVEAAGAPDGLQPDRVRSVPSVAEAVQSLHEEDFDLVLVYLATREGLADLRGLRKHVRLQPIIVITDNPAPDLATLALQAGAQDCLVKTETDNERFARAVRFSIERQRFQASLDEHRARRAGERELGGLDVLSGSPPAPVSGRSLGQVSFSDIVTGAFTELVDQYADAIELAIEARAMRVEGNLSETLNAYADRLGLLGAGPRDVIDVHKTALRRKLEGVSVAKARAYIEESRLLLLQVMGYLALFYRNLSWGRKRIGMHNQVSAETHTNSQK